MLFLLSLSSWPVLATLPAAAPAAVAEVRIVDTWPAADVGDLPRNQSFYVRLSYRSDTPVGIWLRPMYRGQPARAGSNPSARYIGEGEALGWFFLMQQGDQVDEIRVVVGDGSGLGRGDFVAASLPVNLTGGSMPAEATPPEWVTRLKAEAEAAAAEARRQAAQRPMSATETGLTIGIIVLGLLVCVGSVLLPIWGLWRWRGPWRLAAAAPAAMMSLVMLNIVVDVIRDPTSHNLWPFEVAMWGAGSVAVMLVLFLLRWMVGAGRQRRA
ncbi:hypothetical protein F0415_04055 [Arenimonas fontis]|uniref:Uncharacterized protein n=1 Tax=Arenimonas fontis TaxID=2608255 RepID=A0A5B2ZD67_9GAMM|nr:hypothetical protein F0415_04055 [Arenimonas fontis]